MKKEKRAPAPKYGLKRLWQYLCQDRATVALCLCMLITSNLLELAIPMLTGKVIDSIVAPGGVNFTAVFQYCAIMLACFTLSSLLSYFVSLWLIKIGQNLSFMLRRDVFKALSKLPASYFDRHPVGDILSRICYDVDTLNSSISSDMLQVLTSIVTVAGALTMLVILSPVLSAIIFVSVGFTIPFINWQTKRMRALFVGRSTSLGTMNGQAEESISLMNTVSAYGREQRVMERFAKSNAAAADANYAAEAAARITGPTVNLFSNIALSLGSMLGAILCLNGRLTLGAVSSFVLYSRKYAGPVRETANILSDVQSAGAAADRVFNLIDEPPEPPDAADALELRGVGGDVTAQHVDFAYEEGRNILSDFCIDVKRGSVVAIVGPTGAGKTTIVNLLMRFYEPQSGRILLDGKDIASITRGSLRGAWTMVLQETWLFSGTIYENIAYGNQSATREQVLEAAKAAHMHAFIMSLPQGYDTQVTDDMASLSKGQRQLLAIARAMISNSHMLILDEATSNVDCDTELQISDAMRRLMRDKTCFIIAHRLSTIEKADSIIVLDGGRIIESGTHQQLLAQKGLYYDMYHAQFTAG
ncbi:MAG: ABC transporter ATP-binding protein/permease [Christensenellaceae bacterium]|jgi:ATP-binding cassette subfamily B protein|nr:ABC transporter ATP-binding protein/permease [Christensenellaceae bacterium]